MYGMFYVENAMYRMECKYCDVQNVKCKECDDVKSMFQQRDRNNNFINKATFVHCNKFNYDKVKYDKARDKVIITCPNHGDFKQSPNSHLNGNGCSKCNKSNYSPVSITWLKFKECQLGINIQHAESDGGEFTIPSSRYKADGYSKDNNIIFEFHGDYFHGNPKCYSPDFVNKLTNKTMGELYNNTISKKEFIIKNGFTYVEMWENDWRKGIRAVKYIQRKYRLKK